MKFDKSKQVKQNDFHVHKLKYLKKYFNSNLRYFSNNFTKGKWPLMYKKNRGWLNFNRINKIFKIVQ